MNNHDIERQEHQLVIFSIATIIASALILLVAESLSAAVIMVAIKIAADMTGCR